MALGNLEMLTDVDISFNEGRIYGLVGRNGIGKVNCLFIC
jgi:ATPase subunit of ABC transporter with duplicated ATPase domains